MKPYTFPLHHFSYILFFYFSEGRNIVSIIYFYNSIYDSFYQCIWKFLSKVDGKFEILRYALFFTIQNLAERSKRKVLERCTVAEQTSEKRVGNAVPTSRNCGFEHLWEQRRCFQLSTRPSFLPALVKISLQVLTGTPACAIRILHIFFMKEEIKIENCRGRKVKRRKS